MINILILSAGTRNKVVQYFRKELEGKGRVYATDCSELAPAIYEADEAILVPRIQSRDIWKKSWISAGRRKLPASSP